jgi:phage/plasmid-like protein (TIGR03299 family)
MPHAVESMFYAHDGTWRTVPWHGLGTPVREAPTSRDALRLAGLEWEVESRPLEVVFGPDKRVPVEGWVANVRTTDGSVLGVVSAEYRIIQNHEAFDFVDALLEGGEVRYETAGSLYGGRKIWLLARMNREVNILGDKLDPYLLFTNSHDGTSAVVAKITPVRVVCANTLNLALQEVGREWTTIHRGDVKTKLEEAKRTLLMASKYMEALTQEAERLAQIKISDERWAEIVGELIPTDGINADWALRRVEAERVLLYDLMYMEDLKAKGLSGTGWGAINAVADFVAHSMPRRQTATWRERRFDQITSGHPMLDKARDLVLAG